MPAPPAASLASQEAPFADHNLSTIDGLSAIEASVFDYSRWLALGTGLLTILSSLVVVGFYVLNPDMRSGWRRMVVMLSMCDALQGTFYVFFALTTERPSAPTCTTFGVLGMWSASASFLWTACLTGYVAAYLAHGIPAKALGTSTSARSTALCCAIAFGYPTLIDAAALLRRVRIDDGTTMHDDYGCYIDGEECFWRLLTVYAPLWLSMLATCICSGVIWHRLSGLIHQSAELQQQQHNLRRLRRKLLYIPLAFVLLRLPETVYRILEYNSSPACIVGGSQVPADAIALQHSLLGKVLNGLQAFTNPAQGVTTSLIFVWSSPTYRSRFRRFLCVGIGVHLAWCAERLARKARASGRGAVRASEPSPGRRGWSQPPTPLRSAASLSPGRSEPARAERGVGAAEARPLRASHAAHGCGESLLWSDHHRHSADLIEGVLAPECGSSTPDATLSSSCSMSEGGDARRSPAHVPIQP